MGADSSRGRNEMVGPVPFEANVELLRLFLTHREEIVASIVALVNAQRNSAGQDPSVLSGEFEDCFFEHPALGASQKQLRGQLEEAYRTGGFMPRKLEGLHNDLIHPAEMLLRGLHFWQQTGWPVRNRRTHYAHTLFNVQLLRGLELLSMRLWDEDPGRASGRLAELQSVLDEMWGSSPADQPVMVRGARWLIPLAQSLPTEELGRYLEVASLVRETLSEADALEIQRAQVRMLGGHLTSQIRHYCTRDGVPIDGHSVVLRTRTSNALDFALLIQGLAALLKAYERALQVGDESVRLDMAGAICQGISPDPELFLNRVELLSAHSMIDQVFIATDAEGHAVYTALGQQHVQMLKEYGALIRRFAGPLRDDLPQFRPVDGGCSPYGVVFGTPSVLTELMALKTLQRDAETRFSLEDVFVDHRNNDCETSAARLAWVEGWRKLPHIPIEVQRQYDYPQQFAEEIYGRIEREFKRHDSAAEAQRTGRLYIVSEEHRETDSVSAIPELPARYVASSDEEIVAAHKAESYDPAQLRRGRQEGHFLVSYETPGGWVALKKALLEEVLGVGHDARIAGLPREAGQVLQLMCRDLAVVLTEQVANQVSTPPSIP